MQNLAGFIGTQTATVYEVAIYVDSTPWEDALGPAVKLFVNERT